MPGLPQRNVQFNSNNNNAYSTTCSTGSISSNGIWSKHRDDIGFDQLQKFWNELPPHARQELLKIDKQTLLEQARKNLYCSRCNGLLLEGFSQIVMYGKSQQLEGGHGHVVNGRMPSVSSESDVGVTTKISVCEDDSQDPSVHPWGGLIATREGILTLLDCFLEAKSLKALQNVFNGARVRERERELLYPDVCGGGGRGWISQGAEGMEPEKVVLCILPALYARRYLGNTDLTGVDPVYIINVALTFGLWTVDPLLIPMAQPVIILRL